MYAVVLVCTGITGGGGVRGVAHNDFASSGALNPFTTGNPFFGTKLLGFSVGRGLGALKGLRPINIGGNVVERQELIRRPTAPCVTLPGSPKTPIQSSRSACSIPSASWGNSPFFPKV